MAKITLTADDFDNMGSGINFDAMESAMQQTSMGKLDEFDAESRRQYSDENDPDSISDGTDDITSSIKQANSELLNYLANLNSEMKKDSETKSTWGQAIFGAMKEFSSYMGEAQNVIKQNLGEGQLGKVGGGLAQATGGFGTMFGALKSDKEKTKAESGDEELKELQGLSDELKVLNGTMDSLYESNIEVSESLKNRSLDIQSAIVDKSYDYVDNILENSDVFSDMDEQSKMEAYESFGDQLSEILLGNESSSAPTKGKKDSDPMESLMEMTLPSGRIAVPKTLPQGVKAIYDQLTDINTVLKDGIAVANDDDGSDSDNSSLIGGLTGGLLGTLATTIGTKLATVGGIIAAKVSGVATAIGPAMMAAAPVIGGTVAAGAGLAIGNSIVESGLLGETMQMSTGVGDVFRAIMSGNTIAEENLQRVTKLQEEKAERQLEAGLYAKSVDKIQLNDEDNAQLEAWKEELKNDGDLNDGAIGQEIKKQLLKIKGVDIDSMGDDDMSFKSLGMDNVDFNEMNDDQLRQLFKMAKMQKVGGSEGIAAIDASYNTDMTNVKAVDTQRELEAKQKKESEINSLMGLTRSSTVDREAKAASITADQVAEGVVKAHKEMLKDGDIQKAKLDDRRASATGMRESLN
jgi:hypothetical protein